MSHIGTCPVGRSEAGVADHVDDDARGVEELATATGSHAGALYRILRLLAACGVFEEHDGRRFSHTEMSRTLRSDHPTHARAAVRMMGMASVWQAFGAIDTLLKRGGPGWDAANGRGVALQRGDGRHSGRRAARDR
jgi:hypothetical protein